MRAVLDTNVYISGLVFGGSPRQVLDESAKGTFELASSPQIREETERVLRDKFGWSQENVERALVPLWEISHVVTPQTTLSVVQDETDNRILECALAAEAFCIVSGDSDLLVVRRYQGVVIFSIKEFLLTLAGKAIAA